MLEDSRLVRVDTRETPPAEAAQPAPVIPAVPDQVEVLRQHPDRARAVPSFMRLEGVSHQQLAALFERLEFPIELDGIEQFEIALRDPKAHVSTQTFTNSQIDGCPVDILISRQSRVGNKEFKTGGSVSIAPNDMTARFEYVTVTLDTHHIENGLFNLTLDFNQDYIYGRSAFDESWETLDALMQLLETEPVPQSLEEIEFICSFDNSNRPCVTAPVTDWCMLGMLPREEHFAEDSQGEKTSTESAPAALVDRIPRQIRIFNPSVSELRFLARELAQGDTSELSDFDEERGSNSFLSNASIFVSEATPLDLNIWEMFALKESLIISLNQLITIGNSEYGSGRTFMATAFGTSPDDEQEQDTDETAEAEGTSETGESERDQEEDEDSDETETYGIMNDIAAPEISISPYSGQPDLNLVISMEHVPSNEDDEKSGPKVLTASLNLDEGVSREQAWAIVDRITEYFEETRLSTDPVLSMLPAGTPFFELGRVFLFVPSPGGRWE